MGTKNTIQSRTVTVAAGGGSASPAGGQSPVSGLDKQDVVALQARIDELAVKIRRRDDELAESQQRLAAMEQVLQARDSSLAALQGEVSRLRAALQTGSGMVPVAVTRPEIHDVVDQLPKHATLKYATRQLRHDPFFSPHSV